MKLPIRTQTLAALRKARGYSESDLAVALKLPVQSIQDIENGSEQPTKGTVTKLADLLYVPYSLLFSDTTNFPSNIIDFRTPGNLPAKLRTNGLRQVTHAKELQNVLLELLPKLDIMFFSTNISISFRDDYQQVADRISDFLDLGSTDFFSSNDPSEMFKIARRRIEQKRIFVLCHRVLGESFRGFCLTETHQVPLIFINTFDQNEKTKLFTLVHELVHVFMKRDGISDPFSSRTKIEQFCNAVAARVLMPSDYFLERYRAFQNIENPVGLTAALSEAIGLSLHAIALRIDDLGLRDNFYEEWRRVIGPRLARSSLRAVEDMIDEDESAAGDDEEEFRRASSGRRLLNRLGYRLSQIFGLSIRAQLLAPEDPSRLVGGNTSAIERAASIAEAEFGETL